MKKWIWTAAALLAAWTATAQAPMEIQLWPSGAPNSNGQTGPEVVENGRVSNITVPVLYVYRADAAKNTGAAVILCPGGGYTRESIDHEGHQVARWLAANGVTGIVLKYRLPNRHHDVPLSDALQAIRLVRERGAEWGVSPQRIGISGFSAGGHLAASAATLYDGPASRPDFAVLFYPVISFDPITGRSGGMPVLMGDNPSQELLDRYSLDRNVTADTPPMLFFHSDDDPGVTPLHSLLLYTAMKQNKVPGAVYVFPSGGHGWGFNTSFPYHEEWKTLMLGWLRDMKFTAE
jgi:acetyl esterase/lipase